MNYKKEINFIQPSFLKIRMREGKSNNV